MKNIVSRLERMLECGGTKKDIALLTVSGAALVLSLLGVRPLGLDAAWIAILLCGVPIILEAVIGLITAFDIKADVLVSLALIASVCIGETFAAGEVAFIMQLSGLLEELTVAKARAGIEKLVRLTPVSARVVRAGLETVIPAEQVQVGDILRVLPGESVPVDGVITKGQTSINQAIMTGESMPVDKAEGDEVSSGTVNQFGAFEMRAAKVGEDTSLQRMIRLVQSADAGKAKIVSLADRWATWIVIGALCAAAVTWVATGQIIRAVTILVVFCPCSLVLATPTAIMAAIGNSARRGLLVREGDALERLADVKVLAFDKTGTLTCGVPRVVAVKSCMPTLSDNELYELVAGAEQLSEHPLGKAITQSWQQSGGELPPAEKYEQFKIEPGRGISAVYGGQPLLAGNAALLSERGCAVPGGAAPGRLLSEGCTVTYIALGGKALGYIALADTPRAESAAALRELDALGIETLLLTGDNENAAQSIAAKLGVKNVRAGCLPEDKLRVIEQYQRAGKPVCMVGDGVNDAPALKKANVGIAMGATGSDIAVDAADIALVGDELKQLPHLVALSRRMMRTIKTNLTFSMTLNFIAIALAITGILNPVAGALVHNAGSVAVIIHSALLLNWSSGSAAQNK